MFDVQTALDGASFDGAVRVAELTGQGMISLRGDLGDATLRDAVSALTGHDIPAPLHAAWSGEVTTVWMSPDELLILLPYADAAGAARDLQGKLAGTHALVHDMSDARSLFRLTGPALRDTLAKLTPADVSPAGLPVGMARRTRLAQVPGAFFLRDAQTADLVCFRSVARYVFDLLKTAADPAGRVGYFEGFPEP
ncbi:sarcosine oxidase subunit gamma [Palleronia pelagia]|uniref:Sarcosine oxidase subunit gamma n=1 Tax=Palleronia pelagia TaxID=387096 RepID=A0A1H8I309_9RHOB|nr:sarcosine oxidase subunit gamma family protein [Palleronia pelagia]SEN62721.1 sarcosine oxidase subunit gamma [Palleronia pelagia]